MRHWTWFALVLFCLAGPGCALFDKNSKDNNKGTAKATPSKTPAQSDDPLIGGGSGPVTPPAASPFSSANQANTNNPGGYLAGTVVDAYLRPQGNAFVSCVRLDEKDQTGPDVAVQPDGSFFIPGMQPGGHYKLIARAKNGDRMLAGFKYTEAPDIRMMIEIKQEYAGPDTPPVPGPPAYQKNDKATKTSGVNPSFDADWANFTNNNNRPAEMGTTIPASNTEPELPVVMKVPSAPVSAPAPQSNQGWTPTPSNQGWTPTTEAPRSWPPSMEIRGPQFRPSAELQRPVPSVDMQKPVPLPPPPHDDLPPPKFPETGPVPPPDPAPVQARVPSCLLAGGRLQNLALNDINGQPWEFRQHHGKVVLLDFWGTFCQPCKMTMPKLRALQNKYGAKLEIIGIAYERGGTAQEQARRVADMCQTMQVGHRQLLGGGPYCPVSTQFRITGLPTLILLDQDGVVLWRCEGMPDQGAMDELERRIVRQINQ